MSTDKVTEGLKAIDVTERRYRARVRKLVRSIPPELFAEWSDWYPQHTAWLQDVADYYGLPLRRVVRMFAELSVRTGIVDNWVHLIRILEGCTAEDFPGLPDNFRRAKLAEAGDPGLEELRDKHGRQRAPKVRAFHANLLGDYSEVTFDTIMCRVAGISQDNLTGARYRVITGWHARLALEEFGISPAELQAGTWCGERGSGE